MLKQAKVIRHVTSHPNLVAEVQGRGHGGGGFVGKNEDARLDSDG